MSKDRSDKAPAPAAARPEVAEFLDRVRALGPAAAQGGKRGRLIFALDATISRQPTWDSACTLQAEMFREAAKAGGLDIQLVYFRGIRSCRGNKPAGYRARRLLPLRGTSQLAACRRYPMSAAGSWWRRAQRSAARVFRPARRRARARARDREIRRPQAAQRPALGLYRNGLCSCG